MGKFGDGKLKDNELYLHGEQKHMLENISDPKMAREIEK